MCLVKTASGLEKNKFPLPGDQIRSVKCWDVLNLSWHTLTMGPTSQGCFAASGAAPVLLIYSHIRNHVFFFFTSTIAASREITVGAACLNNVFPPAILGHSGANLTLQIARSCSSLQRKNGRSIACEMRSRWAAPLNRLYGCHLSGVKARLMWE